MTKGNEGSTRLLSRKPTLHILHLHLILPMPMEFPFLTYSFLSQKLFIALLIITDTFLQVSGLLCRDDERSSLLLAFPNDSSRPQSWSSKPDCCNWGGVSCNQSTGHVIQLDLSRQKFRSPIPTPLFNLSHLTHLNLSYSFFTDEIPPEISSLNNLKVLDLRGNQLKGRIPSSLFALPYLQLLLLGNNSFQGQVDKFLNVSPSLRVVDLSDNCMNGPLPTIRMLDSSPSAATRSLDSARNTSAAHKNSGISLLLSNNKFSGEIPASICNKTYLEVLDLSNNNLNGSIADCLSKLSSVLIVANLRNNSFTGRMPEFPSDNCSLRTLNLNGNQLEGNIPASMPNCQQLEVLDVGNNRLGGPFPNYNKTLNRLRVLVLRSNNFSGFLFKPMKSSSFPLIQIIDISSNGFSGYLNPVINMDGMMSTYKDEAPSPYPEVIRYNFYEGFNYQDSVAVVSKGMVMELVRILTIFKAVDVSNNNFMGQIPPDIGKLNLLRVLNMSHNNLTGEIPESIGRLTLLESLDLSVNNLSGEIPEQMTNLTFLSVLNLSNNELHGAIPQAKQFLTFSNDSFLGNSGLCGLPLALMCGAANTNETLTNSADGSEDSAENGPDWQHIAVGAGFGGGLGMVVVLVLWHSRDELAEIDFQISGSCSCLGVHHFFRRLNGEDDFDQDLSDSEKDSEGEEEEWSYRRFCVFCTHIDTRWEKVIHKECCCHGLSNSFSSQYSYMSRATPDRQNMKVI
ncbi:hypothetical protein ACLOJK_023538 [Asimina triloba]